MRQAAHWRERLTGCPAGIAVGACPVDQENMARMVCRCDSSPKPPGKEGLAPQSCGGCISTCSTSAREECGLITVGVKMCNQICKCMVNVEFDVKSTFKSNKEIELIFRP